MIEPDYAAVLATRAEEVADTVGEDLQAGTFSALAETFAKAGMWDRTVRIARAIEDIDDRHVALDHLVRALAKAQQQDRAERLALDIDNADDQGRVLVVLADALAEARLWDRTQRVVGRIDTSTWRAIAMAAVAKRLAHSDYERAVQLVTEARIVAHVGGGGVSLQVLIAHAVVLAERDPESAGQLWTEAEQVVRGITVPEERARMLAVLATS